MKTTHMLCLGILAICLVQCGEKGKTQKSSELTSQPQPFINTISPQDSWANILENYKSGDGSTVLYLGQNRLNPKVLISQEGALLLLKASTQNGNIMSKPQVQKNFTLGHIQIRFQIFNIETNQENYYTLNVPLKSGKKVMMRKNENPETEFLIFRFQSNQLEALRNFNMMGTEINDVLSEFIERPSSQKRCVCWGYYKIFYESIPARAHACNENKEWPPQADEHASLVTKDLKKSQAGTGMDCTITVAPPGVYQSYPCQRDTDCNEPCHHWFLSYAETWCNSVVNTDCESVEAKDKKEIFPTCSE